MDDDRPLGTDKPGEAEHAPAASMSHMRAWSNLWQVPTILCSLLLIALAVRVAINRAPSDDFAGVLDAVEQHLAEGSLSEAGDLLRDVLEPHIEAADRPEQARFHAAVADWTALVQRSERVDLPVNNTRIDRHYTNAVQLELTLDVPRLERWIDALISLGRIEDARQRLSELDVLHAGQAVGDARRRQIALFRRLIDAALNHEDVSGEQVIRWLQDHRNARRTSASEKVWAIAKQAKIRLDAGDTRRGVDQLLIDMRRIEYAAEPGEQIDLAPIYTLLGRGYHILGDDDQAMRYLDRAMELVDTFRRGPDPLRAEAMVLAGRIAVANGDFDLAFERFDHVLRDFADTDSFLPALLGRAEVSSILGGHDDAQHDYRRLVGLLQQSSSRNVLSPRRVGASLVDRHDAALALGELGLALDYALLAEGLFPRAAAPTDVLFRIATTSRQLADNLLAEAGGVDNTDVRTRHEANLKYQQAADYFVRHARSVTGLPTADEAWAESLWRAADSYDLAGLHDSAIQHFEEYLAGRSVADPRRGDVIFRLAQAHHALMQYESAARFYEQVIEEHPRSVNATRSHVPLARSYLALDRRPEAEQQLRQVLAGLHPVQPDAMDFRDALIELGTIYYNASNYIAAIEHLDEAAKRYPDDPRRATVLFRLADSYRSKAMQIAERIREPSAESPAERRRLDAVRRDHLRSALRLFERVTVAHGDDDRAELTPLEVDLIRSAYIHRADCAFYLGEYERAIALYDEAARRYNEHHSSMHALIQIVNCYSALGDEGRAAAAHRRALVRLRQLRDDAFDAPDALLDRQAWERWLENTPVAPARAASARSS